MWLSCGTSGGPVSDMSLVGLVNKVEDILRLWWRKLSLREENDIVAPKECTYGALVCYVSIVAEEVKNLEDLQGGN
ncbi:hypothetical protein L195_g057021 [Trifolium pratense]|uniref:Uncharacterized protein n=1 Tax=Trifolium pratense TaxID=57577 RepID=A0A2K3KUM9_TRIPR|nr:hypothetical protein L195_g057021 [Trifolium pratense]